MISRNHYRWWWWWWWWWWRKWARTGYMQKIFTSSKTKLCSKHYRGRTELVQASWNLMAHAQKPDFVFRRNGRVHLNRRKASVQSTTGSQVLRNSGNNAGYTMFRGSVNSTGYPLHSPVSPSLPLPCVTVCHHISTGVYYQAVQNPRTSTRSYY